MFRRKEEDMQDELDVTGKSDQKTQDGSRESGNSAYQQGNNENAPRPAAARAPAPTAPVPGYRPQQQTGGMPPANAGGQRPGMQPAAPAAARPGGAQASGAPSEMRTQPGDVRQAPAGSMKSNKRILTVGNDILLKGEIATCDRLVIEGMVDASLKDVHTVEISETGSFKGTAAIEDAEISGLFEGDLTVRNRLTIYATGKVRGRISYGEIEIERGGELTGEIRIGGSAVDGRPVDGKDKKAAA